MKIPKNATAAGPSYQKNPNYVLNDQVRAAIRGAVAEIDLKQVEVSRKLTPAQRAFQALSMIRAANRAATIQLCLREPDLTENEAKKIVRSGKLLEWTIRKNAERGIKLRV